MTVSRRLDYDDPYTTRFTARVARRGAHRGRPAVELESTYFYPESGGQEADRGTIGAARVIDVQVEDDGCVWHVLEGDPPEVGAECAAEIDATRRFDHMQQHTGQHILSAAFERELDALTVSSHLGEERSSIEVDRATADWSIVERVERAANAVVWEDREVVRHWVDDEGVRRFALRKPPVVTGRIRIVEIPEWDASACGGTHTRRTGEVGVIKIVRWERVRERVRFEFLCGRRAWTDHAWRTEAIVEAARRATIGERDVIAHLERAASERAELQKRIRDLSSALIGREARERVAESPAGVAERRAQWTRDEGRTFVFQCIEHGAPWASLVVEAPEPFVMVARSRARQGDLRTLVPELKERTHGKGGGSPDAIQIAAADATSAVAAWEWATSQLPAQITSGA